MMQASPAQRAGGMSISPDHLHAPSHYLIGATPDRVATLSGREPSAMMHCNRLLCVFAISAGLVWLTPAATGQQESKSDHRAFSADRSVSVDVPAGWTDRTTDFPLSVKLFLLSPSEGSSDSFPESVLVTEDRLVGTHALNDYVEWTIVESRRRHDGFRVLEDASTQLSGRPARLLVVQYKIQGVAAVKVSYYVERDRIAYAVTGTTLQSEYESWGERLKSVCLTFKLE